jgi:hypothetical protein
VRDHSAAFWLILIGGVLTVLGIGLTVKTVNDIRRAVQRFDRRFYITSTSHGEPGPRPPVPTHGPPMSLENRVLALEQAMSQIRWEWHRDDLRTAEDVLKDAVEASQKHTWEVAAAFRDLLGPLTRQWWMAGVSALFLLVGVALQTAGGLLAL